MNELVRTKLERAIRQLLAAGWNTGAIRDALCKQQSFGKYDGCTPTAIFALANEICREVNRKNREEDAEIARLAVASLRESFPSISRYFHP